MLLRSATRRTTAALLPVLAVVAACAGAKDQDVLGADETSGTSSSSTSSSSGGSSTSSSSGGSSSGSIDAGDPPAPTCVQEAEPNDAKETANVVAPTRCGAIQPPGERDFLKFTLKPTTKSMSIKYEGRVTLTVTVEGADTVVLGGGGSQTVPFVMGKPYYVEIRSTEKTARVPWRVDLVESP
jgi:hypothetical protein